MAFLVFLALAAQTPDTALLERRMVELVNGERGARGIPPLESQPQLSELARKYSERMAASGRVDHELDRPLQERILEVLPGTCKFGENVARNTSVEYALSDLMTSDGHRDTLLNPDYEMVGIGIVRGKNDSLYITQEFARRCGPRRQR